MSAAICLVVGVVVLLIVFLSGFIFGHNYLLQKCIKNRVIERYLDSSNERKWRWVTK